MNQKHKNGYYTHIESGMLCDCRFAGSDCMRFFNAVWGPHGHAMPGQYIATDGSGFSRAYHQNDFEKSFEWFGEYGDKRVSVKIPDITSSDFLKTRDDVLQGYKQYRQSIRNTWPDSSLMETISDDS